MLDLETILILICESLETTPNLIRSKSRAGGLPDARSLFIFFGNLHGHSFDEIAKALCYKKYQGLGYHVERVEDSVKFDKIMQKKYADCSAKIKAFLKSREHLNK